ncbi:hypothetical protein [Nocardia cyriacigeorgica]|uniref:Glutamine amidotransferase type-2 domain-containing protein n=2 Tax=Nocardia cyriacigeorgica TaxID=135487 RepID=H6R939_NOCCG|nr:hypothetical protein [Nocardia cyriacigeorgica]TLF77757.1 hypothetical protein FEK34_15835 [Nocardia cyriacigeorgica]CCF63614.1 protein of unknown function, putative Glutamine amidotransferase domain [Nocardia cyriacigeorgica GUH-2]
MCILTFVKPGIAPNLDNLRAGALANPHGHGYAIHTGTDILVGRGMNADTLIDEFAAARSRHPDGPALFHSRLATHGPRNRDNCHPFAVGGDERTVMAHNGILPANVHPKPGDLRSDTRIAAENFLPARPFGSLDSWSGRERLEQWLGTDKMVLLTVDPAYRHPAYIFNEHRGHWNEGSWYSNDSYLLAATYGYLWEFCDYCGEPDDNDLGPHCSYCGYCAECARPFPACVCPDLDGTDRYADLLDLEYT